MISEIISKIFTLLFPVWSSLLRVLRGWFAALTVALVVVSNQIQVLIGFAWRLYEQFVLKFDSLTANIDEVALTSYAVEILGKVNTFIPLDLMVDSIIVYSVLYASSAVVRMIKSLIPGL